MKGHLAVLDYSTSMIHIHNFIDVEDHLSETYEKYIKDNTDYNEDEIEWLSSNEPIQVYYHPEDNIE